MLSRKKMIPPTQIQYQVFHWPAVVAAAFCTSVACAWFTSAGGILLGSLYLASWVNSAGWAWITLSSGANFCALASCVASFCTMARTSGGIFCAVAVTFGGIFCAAAMTLGGTFW